MFNSESIREQGLTFNAQRATLAPVKNGTARAANRP